MYIFYASCNGRAPLSRCIRVHDLRRITPSHRSPLYLPADTQSSAAAIYTSVLPCAITARPVDTLHAEESVTLIAIIGSHKSAHFNIISYLHAKRFVVVLVPFLV